MAEHLSPDRIGRVTGSRVSAILGLNPYQSRADALRAFVREMAGAESEFQGNEATEYGKRMEPTALAKYEAGEILTFDDFIRKPCMTYGGEDLIKHPVHDILAVTPDGLVDDDGMVECKAPYRAGYRHWEDVPYYVPQMQLQMHCADRAWCDFVVLDRAGDAHVSRLYRDDAWLDTHLPTLQAFVDEAKSILADPEQLAPFIEAPEIELPRNLVSDYLRAKREADNAMELVNDLKAMLIAKLGQSRKGFGQGLTITRVERAGSVSYSQIVKDFGIQFDATKYTGKPSVSYMIKEQA